MRDTSVTHASRYRVVGLIEKGGAAEVFDAVLVGEAGFERRVALKLMLRELAEDRERVRLFAEQARLLGMLHHGNLVAVLDFGLLDGRPFVALEHVDGADLGSLIELGPIPQAAALFLAIETARALSYVHRARDPAGDRLGPMHREVRPEHVMISWTGDVKLTGFANDPPADLRALAGLLQRMSIRPELADLRTAEEVVASLSRVLAGRDGKAELIEWLEEQRPRSISSRRSASPRLDVELVFDGEHDSGLRGYRTLHGNLQQVVISEETTERETELDTNLDELAPGAMIGGYRIEQQIASGGYADVYLVRQVALDRRCALKVVRPGSTPRVMRRLEREARWLSRLSHERIVRVLDSGVAPSGRVYFVMEYFEGSTLLRILEEGGARSLSETLSLMQQIADGLAAAHDAGVVHRDLKPDNVLVLSDGSIKIVDFGIARLLDPPKDDDTRLTQPAQLLGTPKYLSPEQIRDPRNTTFATDLYALGVVAYRMLTGRCPFEGAREEIIRGHLELAPPPLPDCGGLERIVLRLLAKSPADRYASARELLAELGALGSEPRSAVRRVAPLLLIPAAFLAGLYVATRTTDAPVVVRDVAPPPPAPRPTPYVVERTDAGADRTLGKDAGGD